MMDDKYRQANWKAHGFPGHLCEHYLGGGDWGTDCKLQYDLCSGPLSADCPLMVESEREKARRRLAGDAEQAGEVR